MEEYIPRCHRLIRFSREQNLDHILQEDPEMYAKIGPELEEELSLFGIFAAESGD